MKKNAAFVVSKFKIGADASAAGPLGRDTAADTD